MVKDNERKIRDMELAREYEKKMAQRDKLIYEKLQGLRPSGAPNSVEYRNLLACFDSKYANAFLAGKYEKPSQFFQREMPWIFGPVIYDRFREAFLWAVDQVRDYPYSVSWERRPFRSENYLSYADRVGLVLCRFAEAHSLDAEISDVLTRDLPEDMRAYITTRNTYNAGFAPEVLAYALDQDTPGLEEIVTDIVNGDSETTAVSYELIRGIVMSHNPRMHQLLCRLLLAARLQEGLRQSICENADWGTMEAFLAILETIRDNNLIRYSSVKRAVGTWIGIVSEETRDLDRVSGKSVELICRCLGDPEFREECLASEDAMAIHIALWSGTVENVQKGCRLLDQIIEKGTSHQVLTAGYFVANLDNELLRQTAARAVLKVHRDRQDILAVYLPSFLPSPLGIVSTLAKKQEYPLMEHYFENREELLGFCDWLFDQFADMKKKELSFTPCIFPWYSAVLKKSDLIEKTMVLAVLAEDQQRIDKLSAFIAHCDVWNRNRYFSLMTMGKKTPAVRKAVISGLQDKSSDTRRMAFVRAKEMTLTAEEYLEVEKMLRLRYDDLRRHAMALLLKQDDGAVEKTISRLLASDKQQIRTAGLDMVTQLHKQEGKEALAEACMSHVRGIENPSTQEKILIDALMPQQQKTEEPEEPLFTEEDRYMPVPELGDYEKDCIRTFMELFPDSSLEKQVLSGKPVTHSAIKLPGAVSDSAKAARKNIRSLSEFFVAHERETFKDWHSGEETPIGTSNIRDFVAWRSSGGSVVPRMDLWEQWRDENGITLGNLLGMLIIENAREARYPYLIRCGKYIRDIYGGGFEQTVTCQYQKHIRNIVRDLIFENVSEEQVQMIAMALGLWMARCLPDEMLLGDTGEKAVKVLENNHFGSWFNSGNPLAQLNAGVQRPPAGHFILHPQIGCLFGKLDKKWNKHLIHQIPVLVNVFGRTFEANRAYLKKLGKSGEGHNKFLLAEIYKSNDGYRASGQPDASTYLYAYHFGLISERSLYYHLMEPGMLKDALELVTAVCAMRPGEGETVSSKTFSGYKSFPLRRAYENFVGKNENLSEEQEQLVELCRRVADRLVPLVVETELRRGDTPAKYSAYVTGIHALSGMETFVRILSALGRDPLDRSVYYWGGSQSRKGNLSYLLSRCAPGTGDDAKKLSEHLKGTDITEKRLIEAALYSPAWIDIIGEYLELPGFKSACYYFMAHMNEEFDQQKKAIIARFTPLSDDELNLGAFDVAWFRQAYEQLGEKKFDLIYDAAKYISDGSKHTRARKYADAALGRLKVEETENAVKDKRNRDLLMAYAIIPLSGEEDLIHRYLYLQQFLKESRQFGAQRSASEKKAVETALKNLSTNAGFSDTMRLTLRMETKLVEDNRELFEEKQIGEWVFRLEVDDQGAAGILCRKDGKLLKSIPAKAKKDPYVLRLQDMKKQLTEQYRRTRRMFEQAMEDSAEFTLKEMRQLWENRVVSPMVSKLVFRSGDKLGFFDGTNLIDMDGEVFSTEDEAILTVAHPLHLFRSGSWPKFQKHLYDNQIIQPFRQVFRELYVKTEDELGRTTSLRYAGNQIQPKKAAACLKERRWVADIEAGLQKIYYQDNIVATIYAMADWFTPGDIEAPTLEYVAFYHRKTGEALKIDEIPDVIFSEVMRDVDMAVSVAHAGGVDPETSHSTVEMRAAILSFTLPLLRLGNVKIEGSHAFIDGKRANYSVHLGSGVVHQLGGAMLNVLPVHSQHRGRFFLPFVDEDPKTAEIISKVILFAEDHKLKDPTILSQIIG